MEKSKKINCAQGPRTGNSGDMAKVQRFHQRHARAAAMAEAVCDHFAKTPQQAANGVMPPSIKAKRQPR